MPESFRVKLSDPTKYDIIYSAFNGRPGIEQVQDQRKVLEPFFRVLRAVSVGALTLALIILAAALLLIINTIRISAFSRRRETGIKRLVGASNLSIRLPFILEGAVAGRHRGVPGHRVTGVAGEVGRRQTTAPKPNFQFTNFIGWGAVASTVPWLFLLGVGVSSVVSAVSARVGTCGSEARGQPVDLCRTTSRAFGAPADSPTRRNKCGDSCAAALILVIQVGSLGWWLSCV